MSIMQARNSASASFGAWTLVRFLYRCRASTGNSSSSAYPYLRGELRSPKFNYGFGSFKSQGLRNSTTMQLTRKAETNMEPQDDVMEENQPSVPPPRSILFWLKWLSGTILPVLFSFWKSKWGNFLKLEGEVEVVVKEVENVAEVVETVATEAAEVAAEVAEKLDDGEIKQAVLFIENISNATAKDAKLTEDFIHKAGDLKRDLEDLETMIKPVIDRIGSNEEEHEQK